MESILNKYCLLFPMRTAFCPLCHSGVSVVLGEQIKKEWKICPNCGEACYVELSQDRVKAIALADVLKDLSTKPAGKSLLLYLLKTPSADLHDLLFNSSKALEQHIMYMTELGILEKKAGKYCLQPQLKYFVQDKIGKI